MRKFCLSLFLCFALIGSSGIQIPFVCADEVASHSGQSLNPVILIPGTSRTKLGRGENGPIVWGNFRNFFRFHHRNDLILPIDSTNLRENRDTLIPRGLVEKFTIIPFVYGVYTHKKFLERMERLGGYQLGDMDKPKLGDNFFVFGYDWRRSSEENAERLAEKIEKLKQFYGQSSVKFNLIVHSSALYMARYYALYGGQDVLDQSNPTPTNIGARNIRKLILISPPHQGAILAFKIIHEGFHPVHLPFARSFSPYEVFTLPAFFEMLPPPGEKLFVDQQGNALDIDLYDASNWLQYEWSVFSRKEQKRLERKYRKLYPSSWKEEVKKENQKRRRYLEVVLRRAKALHEAISEETKQIAPSVEIYSFIFTAGPTLAKVELSKNGKLWFQGGPKQTPRFSQGDLIVTNASMHGRYPDGNKPKEILIHEKHRRMANSRTLHLKLIELVSGKTKPQS